MHQNAPEELYALITAHLKDVALRSYPEADMRTFVLNMYAAGAAAAYEDAMDWLEDVQSGALTAQQAKKEAEVRLASLADELFDTLFKAGRSPLAPDPGK